MSGRVTAGIETAWPLHSRIPLAALPTAPACARGHVRAVACEWGLPELADTAELLASELVTNSVRAYEQAALQAGLRANAQTDLRTDPWADPAAAGAIGLSVVSDRSGIVVHVWDACEQMPVRRDAGPEELGGRGLLLVETLGQDWGVYRQAGGKVVWVLIAAPPA
jgi:hypothetical protein